MTGRTEKRTFFPRAETSSRTPPEREVPAGRISFPSSVWTGNCSVRTDTAFLSRRTCRRRRQPRPNLRYRTGDPCQTERTPLLENHSSPSPPVDPPDAERQDRTPRAPEENG